MIWYGYACMIARNRVDWIAPDAVDTAAVNRRVFSEFTVKGIATPVRTVPTATPTRISISENPFAKHRFTARSAFLLTVSGLAI